MKEKNERTSDQQLYDFEELIDYLNNKVTKEIYKQEKSKKNKEKKIKTNIFLSKFFGNEGIAALITILTLILGLFSISGILLIKSYDVFHTISLVKKTRELASVLLALSSATTSFLGIGCLFNFNNIFESLSFFYKNVIINPLENILENACEKGNEQINQHNQKITELNNIIKKLTIMKDDFKYLIHSSLKDKVFTKKEVEIIYKHLSTDNISALIYLLYHDRISDIKKLSSREKQQLASKLEEKIKEVRTYAENIQLTTNNNLNNNQHRRRMERFHTYPHDNMITETFSDINQSSRRGRK